MPGRANERRARYRRNRAGSGSNTATQAAGAASTEQRAQAVRLALEQRGALCSSFGLYLGSRIDLFPGEVCRALLQIPDVAGPLSTQEVRAILAAELGSRWELCLSKFDDVPLQSNLISQSHH